MTSGILHDNCDESVKKVFRITEYNRKAVYGGKGNICFTKNFVGSVPPEGLQSPTNFFIKKICQKDYNEDGTHYGTMFDKEFGIPVYSAYTLSITKDKIDLKA